ncbi:Ig-like domain-containing protein [Pontiella sulfatireligans]|uniref:Chitodextrinase n=1 Tax=Pontiella sulfatireligans TaxID=2750658 RepID=A0A6C2UFV4_9BACT|nr:Ig-like domain-containing protein [Pontiella sulfatireligans]VGO18988.1 Chitodextrinase [Pontiella sulfatireligans]
MGKYLRRILGVVVASMLLGLVLHTFATSVASVVANIELGGAVDAPEELDAVVVNWVGDSSAKYTLQKSLDLTENSWSNIAENIPGVDGIMVVTNGLSEPQAFYQVIAETNAVPDVDITPPTVSLTSPADQDTVGGTISVEASASDASGIKKVGLYIDDGWVVTDQGAPYQFDYDTTALPDGSHLIKVRAVDNADNYTVTSNITVIVDNTVVVDNAPPTVSLTSPVDQDTVSGTISVEASASDASGIKQVGFYIDDGWVETDHGAPYQFDYDTTALSDGAHLIKVKAIDLADNFAFTSNITVVVDNAPAVITMTSPEEFDFVRGTIVVAAAAAEDVEVKHVALYVDDVFQTLDESEPYEMSYDTTGLADGEHQIQVEMVDLSDNSSFTGNITIMVYNTSVDMRTRARLLGYLFAEGSCANPLGDGDKFAIAVKYAQNTRALWCAQQMEDAGLLTIVSSTDSRIVLKDLPWDIPYAPVSWNTDIYMTFDEGLPEDPDNPGQWAPEVYNSQFIAAIIEGEGGTGGLIDDQSGWGDYPLHITELCDLLNEPVYDCDAYLANAGKDVRIPTDKFYVVREFEYVSIGRVPGGSDGLVAAPTPPEYATP